MQRSCYLMGMGTVMVLLISRPMVDILDEFGKRLDFSSYYIAFVLAPLASTGTEMIAAYNYSLKKTRKSITISLETLYGSAIINNTLGLGIFLGLVYTHNLAWMFSAETLSVLAVQLVMAYFALKTTLTLADALVVASLYPLSIAMVVMLESMGLD
jgi:Ca2+/H+ antiporter